MPADYLLCGRACVPQILAGILPFGIFWLLASGAYYTRLGFCVIATVRRSHQALHVVRSFGLASDG